MATAIDAFTVMTSSKSIQRCPPYRSMIFIRRKDKPPFGYLQHLNIALPHKESGTLRPETAKPFLAAMAAPSALCAPFLGHHDHPPTAKPTALEKWEPWRTHSS